MAQMAQLGALRSSLSPAFSSSVAPLNQSNPCAATRSAALQKRRRDETLKVCCARASAGQGGQDGRHQPHTSFPPPGELQYFGKLSASCVAGAVLVKYGSLCVPSVTTPNLSAALVMVTAPCFVSVVLLALASMFSNQNAKKQ